MKRRGVISFVASIGAAGCVSENDDELNESQVENSNSENDGGSEKPQVEILEHEWTVLEEDDQDERYGVEGILQNITDDELGYVRLQATFVDDENTILEQRWMAREFVGGGEKATFELPLYEERASAPPDAVDDYEIEISVEQRISSINDGTISTENVERKTVDEDFDGNPVEGVGGMATNTSDQELGQVTFYVNFYDGNTIVYDDRDSVSGLDSDQSYEFSLAFRASDEYEFEDYTLNITYQTD